MPSNKIDGFYCMKIDPADWMTIFNLFLLAPSTLTPAKGASPSPLPPHKTAGVSSPHWGSVECAPDYRMVDQSHIMRHFWVCKMKVESSGQRTASLQLDVQIKGLHFISWWTSQWGTKIMTIQLARIHAVQVPKNEGIFCLFFR